MKIFMSGFALLMTGCFAALALSAQKKSSAPLWVPRSAVAASQEITSQSNATGIIKVLLGTHYRKPYQSFFVAGLAQNPTAGPFFFESAQHEVIIAAAEEPKQELINSISRAKHTGEIIYHAIDTTGWPKTILLNTAEKTYRANINLPADPVSAPSRIRLTPNNLAEMFAKFSFWEGVSLDAKSNQLNFIGNNKQGYPQIAESDIITAYSAIFNHEAIGEPLFVDMDFSGNKKDYTVTFGGGFEDTRIGRVLLSADLLLKAFSLGIDPWTDVPPLTDDLCSAKGNNPMQTLYCKYIKGSQKDRLNALMKNMVSENTARAKRIPVILTSAHDGDASSCILTLFTAGNASQQQILSEIRQTGSFHTGVSSTCGITSKYSSQNDKKIMLERANTIFSLTSYEKSIVLSSYRMKNPVYRSIYSLLALGSARLKAFLDYDPKRRDQIFTFFEKVYGDEILLFSLATLMKTSGSLFYNDPSYRGMFLFTYLLSEDAKFMDEFFKLNEGDRLTFTYIATAVFADPGYVDLVDKIQYAQPMCNPKKTYSTTNINNFNEAFGNFVCNQLSQFKRTYLADLIRKELKSINYKTASEISSGQDAAYHSNKMQQTRFWFFPGNQVVSLHKVDYSTFLFNKPNMVAKAARLSPMNKRRGPFDAVDLSDEVKLPEDRIPGIHDNLDIINKNYDALSDLFPTLKELNNIVKLLAFFRWIRDIQPNAFNLDAFETAAGVLTPTPRKYPIYQTVTALGDGTMVRVVGGVDLHSKTQVGLKDLTELKDNLNNGRTRFEGKEYLVASLDNTQRKNTPPIVLRDQNTQMALSVKNASDYCSGYLEKENELALAIEIGTTFFHDKEMHLIQKDDKDLYHCFQYINNKPSGSWVIKTTQKGMLSGSRQDNVSGNEPVTKFLNNYLAAAVNNNIPVQEIWDGLSLIADDVKMVATAKRLDLKLQVNGNTVNAAAASTTPPETPGSTNSFAVNFVSPLSTDSIYFNSKGLIGNLDFDVKITSADGTKTWPIKGSNINIPMPSFIEKAQNPVLSLAKTEYASGSYKSFELVNRSSLVQMVSVWQQQLCKSGKFVLLNNGQGFHGLRNISSIGIPAKRMIIADTRNMSQDRVAWFTGLKEQHPDAMVIVNQMKDIQPFNADEIIWITCLDENALQQRLTLISRLRAFSGVKRFRCFNIDNAVTDLGYSLFGENPQLELAGAWPHAVDFITLQPVLEQLLSLPKHELNQALNYITKTVETSYRADPSPLKLRIAHYLPDLLIVWEEVGNKNFGWAIDK